MLNLNSCEFTGRLGGDVELRYTNNGTAVANFSIAVNRPKVGQKQVVDWMRIVVFGKAAEVAAEHLHKGRAVYVRGRLQVSKFEDRDGNMRTMFEIVASNWQFLDNPPGKGNANDKKEENGVDSGEGNTTPEDSRDNGDNALLGEDDLPDAF